MMNSQAFCHAPAESIKLSQASAYCSRNAVGRKLLRYLAILMFAMLPPQIALSQTFTINCSGCHGALASLPNGTNLSGAIRAVNNVGYLNTLLDGFLMGNAAARALTPTQRSNIIGEINGQGVGASITSAAPPGGTVFSAYSYPVTASGKPALGNGQKVAGAGDPLASAFSISAGALPTTRRRARWREFRSSW